MSLAIGKPLTVEQRLHKATTDLIGREEFIALAGVLMIGSKRVCDNTPTAYTNGKDEVYGRAFVERLSDAEFRFLMLHECGHKMYRHLTTWDHLWRVDKDLANRAADHVVNLKLIDTDAYKTKWIAMPDGGLADPKFIGMDVAQVFKALREQQQQQSGGGGRQSQTESSSGGGDGFDEHDWEGSQQLSREEQQELAKQIDEAVRQGAILAGKVGQGSERLLSELLETKQDWRELLKDFMVSVNAGRDFSSYRKVNRRYIGMDMVMPGPVAETAGDVVIATDTSGSIGDVELAEFMGEIKGICDQVHPARVHIIYWDTAVRRHEVYLQDELDDLVKSTKPAGGGGTMVECVPTYLKEKEIKPDCVVVLTDGYLGGSWGTWDVPVLWAIKGNKRTTADVGVTIHIDD